VISVALVDHPAAAALARSLPQATVVAARGAPRVDRLLARRGFVAPLSHLPLLGRGLRSGTFDLVHAFAPAEAAIARRLGRPVVFTCVETLTRETIADRRLRLRLTADAVEGSDAVVASSASVRDALWKWMAVDVPVIGLDDAAGYSALYDRFA
jgi:hypothetical protein